MQYVYRLNVIKSHISSTLGPPSWPFVSRNGVFKFN
jgi:hypothetical protein